MKNFSDYPITSYLRKDWIFPFRMIPYKSKILLYGAGEVGQTYYEQINYAKYVNIVYWVDKEYDKYRKFYSIRSIDEIDIQKVDFAVLAAENSCVASQMYEALKKRGFEKERIVWNDGIKPSYKRIDDMYRLRIATKNQLDILEKDGFISRKFYNKVYQMNNEETKLIIPRLVLILTTRCTLRCKFCNNLIPYYGSNAYDIPVEEIIKNVKLFVNNIDVLLTVELIGGEPFLYTDLHRILDVLVNMPKVIQIEITTNATVLPPDELLCILKHPKIKISISHYMTTKNKNFIEKIDLYNIKREISYDATWIDSGDIQPRGRTLNELKDIYEKCGPSYTCKTLMKGCLYACCRSAHLHDLGVCNSGEGELDINASKNLRRDIKNFFLQEYDMACDFCDFTDYWRAIDAGVQIDTSTADGIRKKFK